MPDFAFKFFKAFSTAPTKAMESVTLPFRIPFTGKVLKKIPLTALPLRRAAQEAILLEPISRAQI
jgi:hypothetical protein